MDKNILREQSAFDFRRANAYAAQVDARIIRKAPADISGEIDPTLKSIKLASLCSALWAERGVELVVVGGRLSSS